MTCHRLPPPSPTVPALSGDCWQEKDKKPKPGLAGGLGTRRPLLVSSSSSSPPATCLPASCRRRSSLVTICMRRGVAGAEISRSWNRMADNCPGLEPWSLPSLFTDFSDAFAGDTEALIHALQMSLSDDSKVLAAIGGSGGDSPFLVKSELSVSDAETSPTKRARSNPPSPTAGKMKRKSRASKRSATTYITVDPANFRQMVQQVTGVSGPYGASATVLQPEPRRLVVGGSGNGSRVPLHLHAGSRLPTLDTSSSSLLDRAAAAAAASRPPSHTSSFDSSAAFDLGRALPCFPTLESWSTM